MKRKTNISTQNAAKFIVTVSNRSQFHQFFFNKTQVFCNFHKQTQIFALNQKIQINLSHQKPTFQPKTR